MKGKLYLCPTPIGNLSDISERILETLKNVDLIAAEDTRVSVKLLNYFDIKNKLVAYHEHNRAEKGPSIVERILAGESCMAQTPILRRGVLERSTLSARSLQEKARRSFALLVEKPSCICLSNP